MKHALLFVMIPVLICCKGESNRENSETNPKGDTENLNVFKDAEKSTVTIKMEGTEYKVRVNCAFFGEDHFYFKSDKLETTDTNGDGIVITGHQENHKMILTLIVEGTTYSAANFSIEKKEFTAMGTGKLFLEDANEYVAHEATYEVNCK